MRVVLPAVVNRGVAARRGGWSAELAALVRDCVRSLGPESAPDLVVLPELSASGYPGLTDLDDDERALAAVEETADGPGVSTLREVARETGCAVVFGFAERDPVADVRYNTVAWADPGGALVTYRKVHLTPLELRLFTPGGAVVVGDVAAGRIGLSSCYDKAFPVLYQRQRERGAVLSVMSSAWSSTDGSAGGPDDVWAAQAELFDRSRAAETGMVVVSANYTGPKAPGAERHFCDGRRVVDGLGRVVPPTVDRHDLLVWDLDLALAGEQVWVLNEGDFFTRDRREFV